jgi:hypothetical protein
MANKAKASPDRCHSKRIRQSQMRTAIYQLMGRVAKHDEVATPGSLLEIAQQTVGAHVEANVTIHHHQHANQCGNTVTYHAA